MAIKLLGLDVGERRIGVASADSGVKLAYPLETIDVDGNELTRLQKLIVINNIDVIVVGLPRNQSGEETAQSAYARQFADGVYDLVETLVFQDESLTSVQAEDRLKARKKPYTKGDIDKEAASIILQDYVEQTYGK